MPLHYQECYSEQVRQDSTSITLEEIYGPIGGGWSWAKYPAGSAALAQTLMRAAISGASGGKVKGSWVAGTTVISGISGASCGTRHRRKAGYEWGYWRDWGWNFEMGIYGSAYGSSGAIRFTVPAPPEGASLLWAQVRIWTSGYANVSTERVLDVGVGTFEYEVPFYNGTGGTLSNAMRDSADQEWMGYWPGWYEISSAYLVGLTNLTYHAQLEISYTYDAPAPCNTIDATNISDTGGTIGSPDYPNAHWQWGVKGDATGNESVTGILTGLTADTWYWYKIKGLNCTDKTFWFKTQKTDDPTTWAASIITLPATEVWDTGATVHGLFWYKGNAKFYVALGFEWGVGALDGTKIHWLYTLGQAARDWGAGGFKMPIQMTLAGLLPDLTYNYRACLHVHNSNGTLIPMNTNNYFGETMQFGGPVSMFGVGREYVTAKKAEDDISVLAAGRYYMDKSGVFQYESYKRRLA